MYQTLSPISNEVLATYSEISTVELQQSVSRSSDAQREIVDRDLNTNFILLASLLEERKEELGSLMVLEMGKLISEAIAEVEKCSWLCRYYVDQGPKFLEDEILEVEEGRALITYAPLGTILLIMPWNFPFWQVFRCAVPTLMAGNSILLKHASNVPQCAAAIEGLFIQAGFPKFALQNLFVNKESIKEIIKHPQIAGVSLTGSTEVGRSIYQMAASSIKPVVLELGGSDPYIIFNDADLELAVEKCAQGRMLNCGQSCIGAKRFLIQCEIYGQFVAKFRKKLESYTFGDPHKATSALGPMASYTHREKLHKQVLKSVSQGSHLLMGGYMPENIEGAFYPPTILTEVEKGQVAYNEELFGPVATVIRFDDINEAIEIANDTSFGLGAAIFSKDEELALRLAKNKIKAGNVFINDHVRSHPGMPFGGTKESGVGRELWKSGIRAFTNAKTIFINEN